MANDSTIKAVEHGRITQAYPDPTNDEIDPSPYPALQLTSIFPPSSYPDQPAQLDYDGTEATRQYLLLANRLPNASEADDGTPDGEHLSDDEFEGLPMANSYLNIQPELLDSDRDDNDVDESEVEAATDIEPDAQAIQSRAVAATRGRAKGRRGWKWALRGTAHDPKLARDPDMKPRGRGRGARSARGRRRALDPGREFKAKQAKATQAFVEGRLDDALESAREAVQANPEVFAAHSLLGEILLAQGQEQDSLAALLSGAVTARDPNTWIMVAERTLDYATNERSHDVVQQAVFCYTQAIDLEKRGEPNVDARIAKMHLWCELEEYNKARRDCKQLVGMRPDDIDLVRHMAELCSMTSDGYEMSMARKSYELALRSKYHSELTEEEHGAAWTHLNIYLDLVDKVAAPVEAVILLKHNARIFLGRGTETFWDRYQDDDREFDIGNTRRNEVAEFQQRVGSCESDRFGNGLPIELRIKLGVFRLKMGMSHRAEAMYHFEHLMQYRAEVDAFYDMFNLVATYLAKHGAHDAAVTFFEPIKDIPDVLTEEFWMDFGHSLKAQSRYEEAAGCFEKVIEMNPINISAKVCLARLYQDDLKDLDRAHQIVQEITVLNKQDLLRRERLHMRPKGQGRPPAEQSRKRQTEHSQDQSLEDEDEDGQDIDSSAQPVTPRKRPKAKGLSRSTTDRYLEGDLNDESNNTGSARKRKKGVKRSWRGQQKDEDGKPRITKTNERKMHALESMAEKVSDNYKVIRRLWSQLNSMQDEALVDEWFEAALTLYEIFRNVKHFYPTRDKHKMFRGFLRLEPGEAKFMNEMESWKKQLEGNADEQDSRNGDPGDKGFADMYSAPKALDDNTPKDFYDIPFATWHHIFVDLALIYARRSRQAACYQVIDDGLYSANVFYHDTGLLNTTQATSLCCGFIFNDSERLCFAARWFLNKDDLRPGAGFQLFSAVNRLSFGSSMWFSAGPTQKHMLRSIKALDYHVLSPEVRTKFDWSLQLPTLRKRVEKYGEGTGHLDANALLTYGHMVGVANHSQSALPYFFRAFALQPENITINLSIATMYIQNAMKRQTDNRQYGIAQGLTFLHRYYNLRMQHGGSLEKQEAEFNLGRAWHMLGLTNLAVTAYEKALALAPAVQAENDEKVLKGEIATESFTQDTAYALVNLYAITGNDEHAKTLTEEWLVL